MKDAKRRPVVSLLFSLFFAPLGQVYNGQVKKAVLFFLIGAIVPLSLLIARVPQTCKGLGVFMAAALVIFIYIAFDAVKHSILQKQYTLKPYNRWYIYLLLILLQVAVVVPLFKYLALDVIGTAQAFKITTGSMEPTLRAGDHVMADMSAYRSVKPGRGEIVVYRPNQDRDKLYTHRCIAVEGDRLDIKDGSVYINDKKQVENYVKGETRLFNFGGKPITGIVPAAHAVILGDNRENAADSRYGGYVPLSAIKGRVLYVYYSPDHERIGREIQ